MEKPSGALLLQYLLYQYWDCDIAVLVLRAVNVRVPSNGLAGAFHYSSMKQS